MKTDIEIAKENKMLDIISIAEKLGLGEQDIELYGKYKAKINKQNLDDSNIQKNNLILVTAMSPTPYGEGKTTMSIGLADALNKLNKKTCIALREPSLGPVFGVKGGACGGGYAQVQPMEDINLHFTGDFHAITAAHNLISALLDNHIHQGNDLQIDNRKIVWKHVLDTNDRQLRHIVSGLYGSKNGSPREDGFEITVASEIMAAVCLALDLNDLKQKISKIVIAYNYNNEPVTVNDIKATGAVVSLLKDAIKPNLTQTLEHTPAIIHMGPFANIAHGCNSIIATKTAMNLSDWTITEAGFGSELGAEKFLDIKCRLANIKPKVVVIVATIRALKYQAGIEKNYLQVENVEAVKQGMPNLLRHINNIKNIFNLNCVVVINSFPTDTSNELEIVKKMCEDVNVKAVASTSWANGGEGSIELAKEVIRLCENENNELTFCYELNDSIKTKIEKIATKIYKASKVNFSKESLEKIGLIEKLGYANLPICIAKTQYSFSDDAKKLNAPKDFVFNINDIVLKAGAGFIVCLAGSILTMPGLPKIPNAEKINISETGEIEGLF